MSSLRRTGFDNPPARTHAIACFGLGSISFGSHYCTSVCLYQLLPIDPSHTTRTLNPASIHPSPHRPRGRVHAHQQALPHQEPQAVAALLRGQAPPQRAGEEGLQPEAFGPGAGVHGAVEDLFLGVCGCCGLFLGCWLLWLGCWGRCCAAGIDAPLSRCPGGTVTSLLVHTRIHTHVYACLYACARALTFLARA